MGHLVIDGIDTVLDRTKYFDNEGGDVQKFVVLNRWQCCHLANKLSKMKVWILQKHQNLQTIPRATLALQHLLRVVQRANVLVQESYRSEFSWLRAAVLQAGNEEAFVGIVQDLKWCAHILNSTLMSGRSTSQEILCVGNRENLDWLQEDHSLGTEADLDKRELLENLTRFKQHHSSFQKHGDAIQQYLLKRYSQHASDWAVEGDLPFLLWDIEGDNALPVIEQLGQGAFGQVHKTSWWELDCAMKTFPAATEWNTEFRKEAVIWTSLKHPNITQPICCTKDRKACSMVMELMSTDLRKLMDKRMSDHPNHKVPFSLPVVVDIMLQMARALKYMHGKGVAHLDIKPSNTLATPASVPELADQGYVDVKLVDFGQAKTSNKLSSSTCTMHTANIGTTQYRAPELFQVSNNCCTRVCILEVLDMVNIVQD
jgi:tRNA A-37 threonylcarbamoyl transferase component Bud32